jgi:hypothetical protein
MDTSPAWPPCSSRRDGSATSGRGRDLAAAVSLANLCFFGFWHTLLFSTPLLTPAWTWRELLAIALNVAVLAALFWALLRLGRRWRFLAGWHRALYLGAPLILLRLLQLRYSRPLLRLWAAVENDLLWVLLAAAAVVLAYAAVRWRGWLLTAAEVLTLCLTAFVPVSFLQAAWVVYGDRATVREEQRAGPPLLPVRPGQPRVVWIVFDEMDWRYVFPRRPASLRLPELDRLRAQSIYAESAFQPGLETSESMMSYLYGRQVAGVEPTGKARFRLLFLDEPRQMDGPGPPNLFSQARQAGFNTALVGWFLPYCRLFHESLNRCYWESMATRVRGFRPDLAISLRSQLLSLSPLEARQRHLELHLAMLEQAKQAVADPQLGLVVLHLAVPHGPAIARRDRGELTLFNFRADWYFDNLALADQSLGVLRREMEGAGLWDASTVIVTSDHSLRWYAMLDATVDARVPFLVKLAGQKQEILFRPPLPARLAHDLTLSLLRGEVAGPEEVRLWLDRRVFRLPPPLAAAAP